jgi:hypothetical protein
MRSSRVILGIVFYGGLLALLGIPHRGLSGVPPGRCRQPDRPKQRGCPRIGRTSIESKPVRFVLTQPVETVIPEVMVIAMTETTWP